MWFEFAVIAMLAYGVLDFLFKVAEEKKADFSNLFLYFYWSAASLAFIFFMIFPESITNLPFLAFFALAQVSLYLISNVLKLESLKHIKSVFAYPLFALHGVAAAILAFIFLGESLGPIQFIGIGLSAVAILLLIEHHHHIELTKGTVFAIGAMLCLAASETIVAAVIDNLVYLPFIGLSYFFAIGPAFLMEKHLHKRGGNKKLAMKLGIGMGLVSLIAFYLLLLALEGGPASIIFPIIALALLVSIVLSILFYKEKLNRKKQLAVLLALTAIIVMHL